MYLLIGADEDGMYMQRFESHQKDDLQMTIKQLVNEDGKEILTSLSSYITTEEMYNKILILKNFEIVIPQPKEIISQFEF